MKVKRWNIGLIDKSLNEDGEGYKCLSESYHHDTKLKLICDKGHIFYMLWSHFKQKHRCSECNPKRKKTIEEIKADISNYGYKCITDFYTHCDNKLILKCNKGHLYETTWHLFQKGRRCKECTKIKERNRKLGDTNPNWVSDRDYVKNLSGYRNRVIQLSNINFCKYYYEINSLNLKRGKNYHLDHIYSIVDGYNNKIKERIIANPTNLQIISSRKNQQKQRKSNITLVELYRRYYKFKRR